MPIGSTTRWPESDRSGSGLRPECANSSHWRTAWGTAQIGPIPALQDRPYERAGSARERTLAEDVGCARGPAVRLRIIRLQFAYLLGLRCAPAQVRRELHDLADRFAGYLRDV